MLVLNRVRVLGYRPHTPTQFFYEYPPPPLQPPPQGVPRRLERNKQLKHPKIKLSKSAHILIYWTIKGGEETFCGGLSENMEMYDLIQFIIKLKLCMRLAITQTNARAWTNLRSRSLNINFSRIKDFDANV